MNPILTVIASVMILLTSAYSGAVILDGDSDYSVLSDKEDIQENNKGIGVQDITEGKFSETSSISPSNLLKMSDGDFNDFTMKDSAKLQKMSFKNIIIFSDENGKEFLIEKGINSNKNCLKNNLVKKSTKVQQMKSSTCLEEKGDIHMAIMSDVMSRDIDTIKWTANDNSDVSFVTIKRQSSIMVIDGMDRPYFGFRDCETDWGYNRCTDILEFEPVGRANLSYLCEEFESVYFAELVDAERGEYVSFLIEQTGTGVTIQYFVVCGDGNVVTFSMWMSHVTEEDVNGMLDTIRDGRDLWSAATATNPWSAFGSAFIDAVLAEDYRFGDDDGDGILNVHDEDFEGPLWEGQNTWFTEWLLETFGDDDDDESDEEEDEDEDDSDDDEEEDGDPEDPCFPEMPGDDPFSH